MTQKEHDEKVNKLRTQLVEAEKQIQDIKKELDELDKVQIEPKSRRWRPNLGQTYFFISTIGSIIPTTWFEDIDDLLRFAIGNVFKTREEAEFEVERLKVIAELKEFAEPDDAEWDMNTYHYGISWDGISWNYEINSTHVDYMYYSRYAQIYFESRERAEEAIKAVGEDRIKKYYLRVKR